MSTRSEYRKALERQIGDGIWHVRYWYLAFPPCIRVNARDRYKLRRVVRGMARAAFELRTDLREPAIGGSGRSSLL